MNEIVFLVYGILFLLVTLYLIFQKNKWALFTLAVGLVLILLYLFLPSKSDTETEMEKEKKSGTKTGTGTGGKQNFVTLQSPILRNTFNYVTTKKLGDGSTGRLEYGGDSNMKRWGIPIKEYTHVKFPNGYLFKLRIPSSSDSYGYFVDKQPPDNFFSDFIEIGTFS